MNPETPDGRGDYEVQVWHDSHLTDSLIVEHYDLARIAYNVAVQEFPHAFVGLLCRPTGEAWPMTALERSWWVSKRAAA